MTFIEAQQLFQENDLAGAIEILNKRISVDSSDIQSLNLRAKIYFKMQSWGEAINDFSSVLEFEPQNQEAKSGLKMAENILGYFTPDMFNP
ncbi:MAG: CDC27 family protein [Prolixibacteraceae bacterium]|jgi:cytochrome c-type biogenesis protein CcmH/NrfG